MAGDIHAANPHVANIHAANLCASCPELMTLAAMSKNDIPLQDDGTRPCKARGIYVHPDFIGCR